MTFSESSDFWRDIPNATVEQDTRAQQAKQWAATERAKLASEWAETQRQELAQVAPPGLSSIGSWAAPSGPAADVAESPSPPLAASATGTLPSPPAGISSPSAASGGPPPSTSRTPLNDISQFGDQALSQAEAAAACGPAAAVRLASVFGNAIPLKSALEAAKQVGWTSGGGMNGISNQKRLLDKLGIPATLDFNPSMDHLISDARSGNPVTISTPNHYWTASDYDPATGKFNVGQSGTVFRGGSTWMTLDQIKRLGGGLNGALFVDSPTSPTPSVAALNTGQTQAYEPGAAGTSPTAQPNIFQQATTALGGALGATGEAIGGTLGGAGDAIGGAASGAGQGFQDIIRQAQQAVGYTPEEEPPVPEQPVSPVPTPGFGFDPSSMRPGESALPLKRDVRDEQQSPQSTIFESGGRFFGGMREDLDQQKVETGDIGTIANLGFPDVSRALTAGAKRAGVPDVTGSEVDIGPFKTGPAELLGFAGSLFTPGGPAGKAGKVAGAAAKAATGIDYGAIAAMRAAERAGQQGLPGIAPATSGKVDKALAVGISNILSASTSFFTNTLGGLSETVKRPIVTAGTAGMHLLTGNPRMAKAELGAAGADMVAIGHAMGDALVDFGTTFTTGHRPSQAALTDLAPEAFPGAAGMVATPALRGMAAFDEGIRTVNGAGAAAAEVVRLMHKNPTLTQAEVMSRFKGRIDAAGQQGAKEAVYEGGGTGMGQTISKWRSQLTRPDATIGERIGGVAANVLLPFSSIPDTILTRGVLRLPVVNELVTTPVQIGRALKAGNSDEAKRAAASGLLSTAVNAAIFAQVVEGNVTGNGPSDFDKKDVLMKATDANGNPLWRPNSVKIGDHWVSYSSLGPVALRMGAIANAAEQYHEQGKKVDPNYVKAVTAAMGETISEAWYIQGVATVLGGMKNGTLLDKAGGVVAQTGDRLVPLGGLLNEARGFTDDTIRDPRNWLEREANRLPGTSYLVQPKLDPATGDPIKAPKDAASAFVKSSGKQAPDPVNSIIASVNLGVPDPPDTITYDDATIRLKGDEEKRRFIEFSGPVIAKNVLAVKANPEFEKLPPERKQLRVQNAIAEGRKAGVNKLYASIPRDERLKRIAELKAEKRAQAVP